MDYAITLEEEIMKENYILYILFISFIGHKHLCCEKYTLKFEV